MNELIRPDLYLDIDGVLLHKGTEEINSWMLQWAILNRDMFSRRYFLSSFTFNGEVGNLYDKFPGFKKIGAVPLKHESKIMALDWTRPFVWIDDCITDLDERLFYRKAKPTQQIWRLLSGRGEAVRT